MSVTLPDDWPHLAEPAGIGSAVLIAAIVFAPHAPGVDLVGAVPGAVGIASAGRLERYTADFELLWLELFSVVVADKADTRIVVPLPE